MKHIWIAMIFTVSLVFQTALAQAEENRVHVYKGIYFGDSIEQVNTAVENDETLEFGGFGPITQDFVDAGVPGYLSTTFGDYLHTMVVFFDEVGVYAVQFESPERNAGYFDTEVSSFRDDYVQMMTQSFGEPSEIAEIEFSMLTPGTSAYSHHWDETATGEAKDVLVGIAEAEAEYKAVMYISDPDRAANANESEQSERQEQLEEDAEGFTAP